MLTNNLCKFYLPNVHYVTAFIIGLYLSLEQHDRYVVDLFQMQFYHEIILVVIQIPSKLIVILNVKTAIVTFNEFEGFYK